MTARPIVPRSRRFSVYAAVALVLVMVAALLATGCIGGDIKLNQDLAVIKFNQDGSVAWMKMIDSGKDDEVIDVIQTSDGGYAIAGGYSTPICNAWSHFPTTPKIIRLSDKGDIMWEKEYKSEMTDTSGYADPIKGLVQTPNDSFYIISQRGSILEISSSGIPASIRSSNTDVLKRTEVNSVFRTHDGGSVIAGFTFQCKFDQRIDCPTEPRDFKAFTEKLDSYGNSSWFRTYEDQGISIVTQIIELNDNNGYAGIVEGSSNESLVIIDEYGIIRNSSVIGSNLLIYKMQPINNDFMVFCLNRNMNFTYEIYYYNNKGIKMDTISPGNFRTEYILKDFNRSGGTNTINYLVMKIGESDFSAHPKTNVSVLKINKDGNLIWENQFTSFTTDSNYIHFRNLIGTSDGGFLIILGVEKTQAC